MKKLVFLSVLCFTTPLYAATMLINMNGDNIPKTAPANTLLVEKLQKQGVQVEATDKLKVVIRVDNLFKFPSSTQLLNSRSQILDEVTQLVRSYGNRLVIVSAHTDNVGSDASKLKRSADQADTVASYMWSQGIPLKNFIILGCADTKPVADNLTAEGSAANRRIEIEIH